MGINETAGVLPFQKEPWAGLCGAVPGVDAALGLADSLAGIRGNSGRKSSVGSSSPVGWSGGSGSGAGERMFALIYPMLSV